MTDARQGADREIAVRREEPWGTIFELEIDSTRPLVELTTSVGAVCDLVDDTDERSVLVLRLVPSSQRTWWPDEFAVHLVGRWEQALRRVERLRAATIAVARGTCVGPALDALLTVDVRIAAPDLRLVLARRDSHLWPGMGLYRLAIQLGVARARQVIILEQEIGAGRAMDLDLIDRISDDIDGTLRAVAATVGPASGAELAVRRQLLLEAPTTPFEQALGVHLAACDRELRRARH